MAVAKKTKTARGRKQDRARVAGGQTYEVQYEAKKTGKSAPAVKKAVKKSRQCAQARREKTGPLKWEGRAGVEARHGFLVRGAFRAGITDRVQHVTNLGRRSIRGDACWRVSTGVIDCPLPCMRIGAILHPTVFVAFADGAGFLEHLDRPPTQRPYRSSSLLLRQHRDGSSGRNP
jgi:hypothetical protein